MTNHIDTGLFAASGTDVRFLTREIIIAAPVEAVYQAWTDEKKFLQAIDPDRPEIAANIELAIGGAYEWLFDGKTGSNGCQILSYIPNRMVSFSWNAPPTQPQSRALNTWVVVQMDPVENGETKLVLTHLGFGKEPHWDETFAYFENAWGFVFSQFKANLENPRSV